MIHEVYSPTKGTEDTEIFYMKHLCHGHLCVPYKSITAESKLSLLIAI